MARKGSGTWRGYWQRPEGITVFPDLREYAEVTGVRAEIRKWRKRSEGSKTSMTTEDEDQEDETEIGWD